MAQEFFDRAYKTTEQKDVKSLYKDWAETYEEDVIGHGYASPARCAAALSKFLTPKDAPIFDFACGTGLSGLALSKVGFTVIDGADISPEMLQTAKARGIYRDLTLAEPDAPPSILPGDYAAITAIGAISPGAAPAIYLDHLIRRLAPGGLIAFSYNDHTLADARYTDQLASQLSSGAVRELFHEEGDHLSELGSKSIVYVLEKI